MTKHPQQTLPGRALFFAQSLTQISQHQQLMLHAALTECAATNFPTADAPGKNHLHRVWSRIVMAVQTSRQPQFFAGSAQEPRRRLGQKLFTGTVYQSQLLSEVERK